MPSTCIPCQAEGIEHTFDKKEDYYTHMNHKHGAPASENPPARKRRPAAVAVKTRRTNTRTSPRSKKK
jgi:hypothetical protein